MNDLLGALAFAVVLAAISATIVLFAGDPDIADALRVAALKWAGLQ